MQYKLDFTEGCVCFSYLINNTEYVDFKDKKAIQDIIDTLLLRSTNSRQVVNLIMSVLETIRWELDEDTNLEKYRFDICSLFDPIVAEIIDNSLLDFSKYWDNENKIKLALALMSDDEFEQIKKYAINLVNTEVLGLRANDSGWIQDILIELVKYDKDTIYECSSKPCECCGDYIENYKLTINVD
jgi:hypothetical protein